MSTLSFYKKACMSLLGCAFFLSGTQSAVAAALNISNIPLMLNESVAPNIIFTLDDSTSMAYAHIPDDPDGGTNTKRYRSAHFNPMYYNRDVTYRAPITFSNSGVESTLSTEFENAYHDGYNTDNGRINLSTNYKVTRNYNTPGGTHQFAEHPPGEFSCTTGIISNNSTASCTIGTTTFTASRGGGWNSSTCSITAPSTGEASCSINNSIATITYNEIPAYYYIYKSTISTCSQSKTDDNCYEKVTVSNSSGNPARVGTISGTDERENFAIWYSFYRTRALATLSAASLAFYGLSPSARLTWQSLIHCTQIDSNAKGCGTNRLSPYNSTHRTNFFQWLQKNTNFTKAAGTQLRSATIRAGEYLKTATPWHKIPHGAGNTTENTYACRPSYHVVMTDGLWNSNNDSEKLHKPVNHDGGAITLPDQSTFSNQRPFYDSNSIDQAKRYSLADYAMQYWSTDLQPNIPNKVPTFIPFSNTDKEKERWDPRNNPATWQHMVNFMMGLGLTASLNKDEIPWEGNTFAGAGYEALKAGTANWPRVSGSTGTNDVADNKNNVYDLWHAAINSRGEFFSVDSPDAMVLAFQDILERIAKRTSSTARPAVSASFVSDSDGSALQSNVYATEFSSEDWSGQITKTSIDGSGIQNVAWAAKANNQSALSNVKMKSADENSSGLQDFTWVNLTEAQQAMLNKNPEALTHPADARGAERLAYIKGSRSNEGSAETHFRQRSTVIGDIINSSPVIVGTPSYLAYLADKIENPSTVESPSGRDSYQAYAAFRATHHKRKASTPVGEGRQEMIYVGANNGMLHGINADTGNIQFSFVPSAVMQNLYRLTGKNYKGGEHRFFVDGSPVVRDVYFDDTVGWRTVLVGTLRAGGKALFALDVTDPANIKLLWEFDASEAGGDVDLGYTFAQPEIARLHTGKWAVLMGNGYNSTNDKAALMIIDIQTGTLLKKLVVPEITQGSGASATIVPNGLSSVRAADNNSDGLADYAYAGDLQGNLWRFDLVKSVSSTPEDPINDPFSRSVQTNVTTDHFTIAYGGKPLFTARDSGGTDANPSARQAITIQPSLVRHPTRLGYLVLFGTGKYFETSDANVDTSRVMTLYGIWDRKTKAQGTAENTATAEKRSALATQQFTNQHDGATVGVEGNQAVNDIRILSQEPISWYKAPEAGQALNYEDDSNVAKWGWALDLKVGNTQLGEMIVNNMSASGGTLFYSSLTPNIDPCADGADTWFYAVDAYTGGRTKYNVLDLSKDGIVNATDAYSSNVVSGVRFPALGGFNLAPGNKVFGSDGANDPATVGDDPNSNGRQSWHIIPEEFK